LEKLQIQEKGQKFKYEASCDYEDLQFIPLVFETGGRWTENVECMIKYACRKIATKIGLPYSTVKHRWTSRLSAVLQRANAMVISTRIDYLVANKNQLVGQSLDSKYLEEEVIN